MCTICFLNNKGGVAKTSTAVTVAHMAASVYGKKTLLVDMDPQGNASSRFSQTNYTQILLNILNGNVRSEDGVENLLLDDNADPHDYIKQTKYENLDIIPSCQTLSEAEERLKANVRTPQQFKLKRQLEKVRREYDLIIIDCSPSISLLNINALVASDEVYIPTKCDGDSLTGVAISLNLIRTVQTYNPLLKVAGCFFTQFQGRKNISKEAVMIFEKILNQTDAKLLPLHIGVSTLMERGSIYQEPLLALDEKQESKIVKDYLKLTEYILEPNKKNAYDALIQKTRKE